MSWGIKTFFFIVNDMLSAENRQETSQGVLHAHDCCDIVQRCYNMNELSKIYCDRWGAGCPNWAFTCRNHTSGLVEEELVGA